MKKIILCVKILILTLVLTNCSNDNVNEERNLVVNQKVAVVIDEYISFLGVVEKTQLNDNNLRGEQANYFEEVHSKIKDLPQETVFTAVTLEAQIGESYIDGTFEFFKNGSILAKEVSENVINDSMTENEKLIAVEEYINANDVAYKADSSGYGSLGGSDCKTRERNCYVRATANNVLLHLGCALIADSVTVASWGATSFLTVACHSAAAALLVTDYSDCALNYQNCISQ